MQWRAILKRRWQPVAMTMTPSQSTSKDYCRRSKLYCRANSAAEGSRKGRLLMIAAHGIWPWFAAPVVFLAVIGILALMYAMHMPGRSFKGPFEPLSQEELAIRNQLKLHVAMLAGTIGERNLRHYEALMAAAGHVSKTWSDMGYVIRERSYTLEGKTATNLEVEVRDVLVTG